ncbi:MAG: VapC toxin family PIN domain ribonuclease, partial [Candidatus Competibacteraceae bacterium]|nr:VapC toxin family PIN domain ribonuclease [Candidatus Competibacteraceae bacterium]
MAVLADVNLLLALVTDRHAHHGTAMVWLDNMATGEVRICRMAQMGLLRLLNNPAVMGQEAQQTSACWIL